ncbi:MAG: hypothetical protein EAZ09_17595 [Oscillatoriales cyanobacterium]|nr:MAG: hypothetical protein EAZ18_16400 [Oscillatoriales cyanobacterium]TAH18840.1 MAG: hypothetical protein EAZ09_17595 [Oscillatoriales cyanobacterium]
MKTSEEELEFKPRPRATETVSLDMPKDALESLKKVAASRDMSLEALLRFYIGQGLRQDLTNIFANRVLEVTAQVLAEHIESEAEISTIIQTIRSEANW